MHHKNPNSGIGFDAIPAGLLGPVHGIAHAFQTGIDVDVVALENWVMPALKRTGREMVDGRQGCW